MDSSRSNQATISQTSPPKRSVFGKEKTIKIVLIGNEIQTKRKIIHALGEKYPHASRHSTTISETELLHLHFLWPESLPRGIFVKVSVFALLGTPYHKGLSRLLLSYSQGVIFLLNTSIPSLPYQKEALIDLQEDLKIIQPLPHSFQFGLCYHSSSSQQNASQQAIEEWLGLSGDFSRLQYSPQDPTQAVYSLAQNIIPHILNNQ